MNEPEDRNNNDYDMEVFRKLAQSFEEVGKQLEEIAKKLKKERKNDEEE